MKVDVWTVDEKEEMERFVHLRVHGIMTDRPSVLRDVVDPFDPADRPDCRD